MNFKEKSVVFVATGCYAGKFPWAPGTLGSLIGVLGCFLLAQLPFVIAVFITVLFILFAVRIATIAEEILKKNDPGCIVIDEIAGMMTALLGIPLHWAPVVVGFIFFRGLDILKPFPIGTLERRLSGGLGVVMDDVIAGIMANIAVRMVLAIKDMV